jgi:hypothetical protein
MSSKCTRSRYTAEYKAEVALTKRQPLAKLAARYQLARAKISRRKLHLRLAPAPSIFNSDQGSQFTNLAYEQALLAAVTDGGALRQRLYRAPLAHAQVGVHLPQSC